jgi:hypothetical protein
LMRGAVRQCQDKDLQCYLHSRQARKAAGTW